MFYRKYTTKCAHLCLTKRVRRDIIILLAAGMAAKRKAKEKNGMEITLKIEGMMCPHCEGRVKKTLEAVSGVRSATVSYEKGTAVVSLEKPTEESILRCAVEAQGYKVLSVE